MASDARKRKGVGGGVMDIGVEEDNFFFFFLVPRSEEK